MATDTFQFSIVSPAGVEWEGEVLAVAGVNSEGPFSILPDHARFMTVLGEEPIMVTTTNQEETSFAYSQSVLYAADNMVKLYVHEVITPPTT